MTRKSKFVLLLVFFYIAFLTHSVLASPLEQDPLESIIIQVLEATRDELGLGNNTIVNESPELNFGWCYSYRTDDLHIIINNYITLEDVMRHHNDCPSWATCDWFSFHGYSARHSLPPDFQFLDPKEHAEFQVDNLLFVINTSSTGNAKSELEVLYRNAVKYGLIPSGEGDASTPITPTVTPHITDTPQPGTTITLTASADNYTAVINQVDNSTNIGSVLITGLVTDRCRHRCPHQRCNRSDNGWCQPHHRPHRPRWYLHPDRSGARRTGERIGL